MLTFGTKCSHVPHVAPYSWTIFTKFELNQPTVLVPDLRFYYGMLRHADLDF